MNLDHICVAVRNINTAREKLCTMLGYEKRTEIVTNTRQKVNVQFLKMKDSIDIKLIEPSAPDSPLVAFLKNGGGLHHMCFRSENAEATLDQLKVEGARVIADLQPGEAFDDNLIAFAYLGFGLNVEIIDTDARRGEVKSADAETIE